MLFDKKLNLFMYTEEKITAILLLTYIFQKQALLLKILQIYI